MTAEPLASEKYSPSPVAVQFAQSNPTLVIPKPALSARNLPAAGGEAAGSVRNAARRNGKF
jgi:hypothetical protein